VSRHDGEDRKPRMAVRIDASGLFYRDLNEAVRNAIKDGVEKVELHSVFGQRYIGTRLRGHDPVEIEIFGTPGNDLGAFLDGHRIVVHGNAQDGVGNTMNSGEIVIHGHAGDILGMSMRGGKIFVREDVGYRAAIHMKEYKDKRPAIVIGGTAQDFFGEYMAGGVVILLGLNLKENEAHRANFIGTGMHGGAIYIRHGVRDYQLGKEVGVLEPGGKERELLERYVGEYAAHFNYDAREILKSRFIKLLPLSKRPYGRLYAY